MKENSKIETSKVHLLRLILREMTFLEYSDRSTSKIIKWIVLIFNSVFILLVIVFSIYIITWTLLGNFYCFDLPLLMGWIFLLILIFLAFYTLILFAELMRKSWLPYKKRYDQLLDAFEWYSIKDKGFLVRLLDIEVPILEFGLIQYRHQWGILKWKMRFWLIPAAAIYTALWRGSININIDGKDIDKSIIIFAYPLMVAVIFYIINQRQRPNQVILLLECVIRLKSKPQKYVPELNPEHPVDLRERLGGIFK